MFLLRETGIVVEDLFIMVRVMCCYGISCAFSKLFVKQRRTTYLLDTQEIFSHDLRTFIFENSNIKLWSNTIDNVYHIWYYIKYSSTIIDRSYQIKRMLFGVTKNNYTYLWRR